MRAAFVGKGGSGKTTLATLFSLAVAKDHETFVFDADINQHLGRTLGFGSDELERQNELGNSLEDIKKYLKGDNPHILSVDCMQKTTPPGAGSRIAKFSPDDVLLKKYMLRRDLLVFFRTGSFTKDDLGVACYHSKTGAIELLLNHYIDMSGQYVVIDMTAGADAFASGLFTRFDVTFLVVEPTVSSVLVYQQYLSYAKEFGVEVRVIANKCQDDSDIAFVKEHVGDVFCAALPYVVSMRQSERSGSFVDLLEDASVKEFVAQVKNQLDGLSKNWKRYHEQTIAFHIKNSKVWANDLTGLDLSKQVDPSFSFSRAIENLK